MKNQTQQITLTAMFCALALAMVSFVRIPIVLFLKYDPKDVIIALSGFIISPMTAAIVAIISSVIEMLTVSDTGVIGCIMNIISSCSFACTAAFVYKRKRSLFGAGLGLILGCIVMTIVMLLWNYCITPIYLGYPRQTVVELMLPAFLPFNLIKSCLNAAFVLLIYKPIVNALRKTHLLPQGYAPQSKVNIPLIAVATAIVITCILVILSMKEII